MKTNLNKIENLFIYPSFPLIQPYYFYNNFITKFVNTLNYNA